MLCQFTSLDRFEFIFTATCPSVHFYFATYTPLVINNTYIASKGNLLCYLSIVCSYRSYLFREYKLCRLLLRPLGDRLSAGHRSGTGLRGYSRQTADSCLSSLSHGPNSAKDVDLSESGAWREAHGGGGSTLYKYNRPGSRAFSLPIYAGLGKFSRLIVVWQTRR